MLQIPNRVNNHSLVLVFGNIVIRDERGISKYLTSILEEAEIFPNTNKRDNRDLGELEEELRGVYYRLREIMIVFQRADGRNLLTSKI